MEAHKQFFNSGKTRCINLQLDHLHLLKQLIQQYQQEICSALHHDLNKPDFEVYNGEIYPIIKEIDYFLQNLKRLARPTSKPTSWLLWPSKSYVTPTPYGTVLIMAPWNFPFQLTLVPLIGAIATGNCAVVKPSEFAPKSAALIAKIIEECFDPSYVSVVQGDAETAQSLLNKPFDYIFFTGSTRVGKIVMHKAADQLIPVTLELGGKCPCIVDETCDLTIAAKRIAWGKFYNAGQNCVSPDYVLIHESKKEQFIELLKKYIAEFYGTNPEASPDYARIINTIHMERLQRLLTASTVIVGGTVDTTSRYIAPTIVENVTLQSPIMQEEIFGPLLPIITYAKLDQALNIVHSLPKPLALYIFSQNQKMIDDIMCSTQSGSVGINDVILQAANNNLPFGGVGASGMGRYHGAYSFRTFSYERAMIRSSINIEIPLRYAPYGKLQKYIQRLFL